MKTYLLAFSSALSRYFSFGVATSIGTPTQNLPSGLRLNTPNIPRV